MRKQLLCLAATAALVCSTPVIAADLGEQCFSGTYRSSLIEQPRPDLDDEINRRYEEAVATSQAEPVISNQRQLWTWANETKVSCGKAIGFLASNEINDEQITQCDCFYGVMFYLAN